MRFVFVFLFAFIFFIVAAVSVFAVPRNPPPVFETEYTLPTTAVPLPPVPIAAENYIAAVLYALFLLLAGLAVHRWRSRKILFTLAAAAVILFGFIRQGCPCPVGMFQNIANALIQPIAIIPWTAIILFTLPLLAALFWGRIFCSAVCPLGAVQELTAIKNLPVSRTWENVLGLFRFVWLGIGIFSVSVGLGYTMCRFDPYTGFFRLSGLYPVLIFSGIMLLLGMVIGRPFCRFMCPYGALLGLCGSLAAKKVTVTPGGCTNCNLCKHVCPYNAILPPTELPTAKERQSAPWKLLRTTAMLPIWIALFAVIGYYAAPRFAPFHLDVQTAELLYAEEEHLVEAAGTFAETRAAQQIGRPADEIYRSALETIQRFRYGGLLLGGWIGLVIGTKSIFLLLRRRRLEYEIDPARCFACGRCFWYCPNQQGERLLMRE